MADVAVSRCESEGSLCVEVRILDARLCAGQGAQWVCKLIRLLRAASILRPAPGPVLDPAGRPCALKARLHAAQRAAEGVWRVVAVAALGAGRLEAHAAVVVPVLRRGGAGSELGLALLAGGRARARLPRDCLGSLPSASLLPLLFLHPSRVPGRSRSQPWAGRRTACGTGSTGGTAPARAHEKWHAGRSGRLRGAGRLRAPRRPGLEAIQCTASPRTVLSRRSCGARVTCSASASASILTRRPSPSFSSSAASLALDSKADRSAPSA